MLIDEIGTCFTLASKPNAHSLEMGKSGMGKTVLLNEQIRELVEHEISVAVVDFSGSFTALELEKAGALKKTNLCYMDLSEKSYTIPFLTGNKNVDVKRLTKIFAEAFCVTGKMQKAELNYLFKNIWTPTRIKLEDMFEILEIMYIEAAEVDADKAKRIESVMDKLQCMEEYKFIEIVSQKAEESSKDKIIVLELSEIPSETREKYTELLLEFIWDRVQRREFPYQRIVLDEIQNLSCGKSQALSKMLREGRKYEIGVMMATQFIDTKDKTKVETLMQAANILFFKPNLGTMRQTAKLIDRENSDEWEKILDQLKVGEVVLKGSYYINDNAELHLEPVICKVVVGKNYK